MNRSLQHPLFAGLLLVVLAAVGWTGWAWWRDADAPAGLVSSNGEARRLIKGGGARLNDAAIDDDNRKIDTGDINAEGVIKLSFGKKRHAVVKAV